GVQTCALPIFGTARRGDRDANQLCSLCGPASEGIRKIPASQDPHGDAEVCSGRSPDSITVAACAYRQYLWKGSRDWHAGLGCLFGRCGFDGSGVSAVGLRGVEAKTRPGDGCAFRLALDRWGRQDIDVLADPVGLDNRRNPNRRMTCGDITQHYGIGTNDCIITDSNVPDHFASDPEVNMVTDDRNSLPTGVCAMHDADAGVDGAVVADDHAVGDKYGLRGVNLEPAANDSARLDLCACYGGRHKPQKAAEQTHRPPEQRKPDGGRPVRQTVGDARPKITVAERGEHTAFNGRIGGKIFPEQGGYADRVCYQWLHALAALELGSPLTARDQHQ